MSKSLKAKRVRAYHAQNGKCYYCEIRMWLEKPNELGQNFRGSHGAMALIRCTAEHLSARSEGGTDGKLNIVAACWFCNQNRHRRKRPHNAQEFQRYVKARIRAKKWHFPQFKEFGWK